MSEQVKDLKQLREMLTREQTRRTELRGLFRSSIFDSEKELLINAAIQDFIRKLLLLTEDSQ